MPSTALDLTLWNYCEGSKTSRHHADGLKLCRHCRCPVVLVRRAFDGHKVLVEWVTA